MDTAVSQQELEQVFDQILQTITAEVAGINLRRGEAPPGEDYCTVHVTFERGFQSSLSLSADTAMFTRLTQNMMQQEQVTAQDVEDFTKEFFNVLCGRIAAELYRSTGIASRFGIPVFHCGHYEQPEGGREHFALSYSSDRNEGARLAHHTRAEGGPETTEKT